MKPAEIICLQFPVEINRGEEIGNVSHNLTRKFS